MVEMHEMQVLHEGFSSDSLKSTVCMVAIEQGYHHRPGTDKVWSHRGWEGGDLSPVQEIILEGRSIMASPM